MGQVATTESTDSATTAVATPTAPTAPTATAPTNRLNIQIVCISDTHGAHRQVDIPNGDILIHGGDFTRYGNKDDAIDFNKWLGELKPRFQHIFVVNGNHENNAPWTNNTAHLLSNATWLKNKTACVTVTRDKDEPVQLRIHGTEFYWSMRYDDVRVPEYDAIPDTTNILIVHNPPKGYCDGPRPTGCPALRGRLNELSGAGHLKLVVCGHIHKAHGTTVTEEGITVVNAANADRGHGDMGHLATLIDM